MNKAVIIVICLAALIVGLPLIAHLARKGPNNASVPGDILNGEEPNALVPSYKVAEQGQTEARFNLDLYYKYGDGALKFDEWASKAEVGDAVSQLCLGLCYANGDGVPTEKMNHVEALKWCRKAADQGNVLAQRFMGACYAQGKLDEEMDAEKRVVPQDKAFAESFLYHPQYYCLDGEMPQDEVEAVRWYRKAADQGDDFSQFFLGFCHANGRGGVPLDDVEAAKWYRKAADQGNPEAQYDLGLCYAQGWGVPKNEEEAVKWYQKAAKQGEDYAEFALGFCYANGRGVAKSIALADMWLSARYNLDMQGLTGFSRNWRDALGSKMSPQQIDEAQKLPTDYPSNSIRLWLTGRPLQSHLAGNDTLSGISNNVSKLVEGMQVVEFDDLLGVVGVRVGQFGTRELYEWSLPETVIRAKVKENTVISFETQTRRGLFSHFGESK